MSKRENNKPQIRVAGVVSKPEKENKKKIELRSGEVQELIGRPPAAILKSGITVILFFVVSFFISSFFIVYPEQMTATAKLFPSMDIDCVNSPSDGRLLWVIDNMNADVAKGDTLAKIINYSADTSCLVSSVDGHAFKADVLEKNMDIKAGQRLFFISRTVNIGQKHEIHGVIYLPIDSISVLRLGQVAEVNYKGFSYPFVVSEFGSIANDEGKYPITVSYVDSLNLFNNVEPETCVAKIKMSNQTVFEKFFAKRLNVLNKYKIN